MRREKRREKREREREREEREEGRVVSSRPSFLPLGGG